MCCDQMPCVCSAALLCIRFDAGMRTRPAEAGMSPGYCGRAEHRRCAAASASPSLPPRLRSFSGSCLDPALASAGRPRSKGAWSSRSKKVKFSSGVRENGTQVRSSVLGPGACWGTSPGLCVHKDAGPSAEEDGTGAAALHAPRFDAPGAKAPRAAPFTRQRQPRLAKQCQG